MCSLVLATAAHFPHYGLAIAAAVLALEAAFVVLEGSFDFPPERLFLSCCFAILVSRRSLTPVLKSRVSLCAHVWSAPTERKDLGVSDARRRMVCVVKFGALKVERRAWIYVSGVQRDV